MMRRQALIALIAIPLFSAVAPEDDRDKIQGNWVCIRVEMGGISGAAKGEGNVSVGIRFEGDHYIEFNGKTNSPRGDFKLDPAKSPKQMDLTTDDPFPPLLGGPKGKTTVPCIYELKGDKLKVCTGSEERPRAFASSRDRPETVLIYKRVKSTR